MPRTARAIEAGLYYHVLNRGNGRAMLFRKPADFVAFEAVLAEGLGRYPVELLCYCLMGNHWHLVLRPAEDNTLGRFMGWVGVTHVRRHHAHYRSSGGGHLYQGRFKSFPVQNDLHFLTLCRYVEANPVRAKLVERGQDWSYSSLHRRSKAEAAGLPQLTPWPVDRPRNWTALVNRSMDATEADAVRLSMRRDSPFGGSKWVAATAKRMGLEYTLRPRGRPKLGGNEDKE